MEKYSQNDSGEQSFIHMFLLFQPPPPSFLSLEKRGLFYVRVLVELNFI
jgi:hypothetical protein